MNPFKSKEWIETVDKAVGLLKSKYVKRIYNFGEQDWEDFRQDASIHIWRKRRKYKAEQLLTPWIRCIVSRLLLNRFRDQIFFGGKDRILKQNFHHPYRILTKTIELIGGNEEVISIPDFIDTATIAYDLPTLDDFRPKLTAQEDICLAHFLIGFTPKRTAKKMKMTYGGVCHIRNRIRRKYSDLINAKTP